MDQGILIALAQYTFLLEVQAQANCEKDRRKHLDFSLLKVENIASSPIGPPSWLKKST
jgi:hypothetical protein